MHLGKFHYTIHEIERDVKRLDVVGKLNAVISDLNTLVSSPGQPEHTATFRKDVESLRQALASSSLNRPVPTMTQLLEHIGAHEFVGDALFERVKKVLQDSHLTPQAASSALTALTAEVSKFYTAVKAVNSGFTELEVEYTYLEPGETELGISMPVVEGTRTLKDLSKVANTWHNALSPFVELFSEDREPIKLRVMCSSDWQFYLVATPPVLYGISLAIRGVNDILRNLIDTKKLIRDLLSKGAGSVAIEALEADTKDRLDREVKTLAESIVDTHYKVDDEGRKNELKNHVSQSLKIIAKEMTENVTLEIRMEPPEAEKAEEVAQTEGGGEVDTQADAIQSDFDRLKSLIDTNMELSQLDVNAREILTLEDATENDNEELQA